MVLWSIEVQYFISVTVITNKDRDVPVHAMKERYSSWYLMDVSGGHHAKAAVPPVHVVVCCVDPRASLDVMEKDKFCCYCQVSNPTSSSP